MSTAFHIKRYTPDLAFVWDKLIDESVNGGFILKRSFMDYHQDRFEDFSYLIWKNNRLIAVFAAGMPRQRLNDTTLIAHPGLTYGGLITGGVLKYSILEEIYNALFSIFKINKFVYLLITPTPRVFCKQYSETSLFFFHKNDFKVSNRELNSVTDLSYPFELSSRQKNNLRKARKSNVKVESSKYFSVFWQLLIANLQQVHNVKPVHTLAEMEYLADKNPENIELYTARIDDRILAGVVLFKDIKKGYLHSQYVSTTAEGRLVGAVDAILFHIIQVARADYRKFSFGISTVKGEINYGLLGYKEGFGGSAEVIDTYLKIL